MNRTLAALLLAFASVTSAAADPGLLLQLVDYVGVDYSGAVEAGAVVNEAEYAEMRDFARRIREGVDALAPTETRPRLVAGAEALVALVDQRAAANRVAAQTRALRDGLMRGYPVALTPTRVPDLALGASLYRQSCASCHGAEGGGDGPAAGALDPPPISFRDADRARQRSLHGLFNTITLGVDGTGMASFAHLTDRERWALAFFVGGLYADEGTLSAGEAAWAAGGGLSLHLAATRSPVELAAVEPQAPAMAAWARRHPEALFRDRRDPLATALARLEESVAAYAGGDRQAAGSLAVSAYLEGFELAEAELSTVDRRAVLAVEEGMIAYRHALASDAPRAEVERRATEVTALLRRAQLALGERSLSPALAFSSSLVILLREGLEAILVLAAIAGFLSRTGRREALIYVHYGWVGALLAGVVTWMLATWVVTISGAAREVTEGITALASAGILFYVGFWMHDKTSAQRWSAFLRDEVQRALDGRALLGISLISFVAVYREVLETVLFYQTLWVRASNATHGALLGGAATAALLLVGLAWAVLQLGMRLPLRQFFAASAAVMFVLAVVFAGKGVVALQEAGKLPISPVSFPRFELLGIYPNLQSLLAQLVLVLAALSMIWWSRRPQPVPG